jgi:hypothetical protein
MVHYESAALIHLHLHTGIDDHETHVQFVAILGIAEHSVHGKVQVWIHHDGGGDYFLGNIFHKVLFEGHRAPYGNHLSVQILLIACILHLVYRLWHDWLYLFDVSGDTTGSGSSGTRGSRGRGSSGGGTDGWGDQRQRWQRRQWQR